LTNQFEEVNTEFCNQLEISRSRERDLREESLSKDRTIKALKEIVGDLKTQVIEAEKHL
jgi:hypothetical protein